MKKAALLVVTLLSMNTFLHKSKKKKKIIKVIYP